MNKYANRTAEIALAGIGRFPKGLESDRKNGCADAPDGS